MLSPFPGVDPYIEQNKLWVDFHNGLACEISAQLNASIRPRFFARLSCRVIDAPATMLQNSRVDRVGMQEIKVNLLSVELYHTENERLVTAIEILSPVNKEPSHEAYTDYLRKRRELLRSDVHFMEIDLLRKGTRPPLHSPVPEAPYYVVLSRVDRRPQAEVWPIQLSDRLPVLPVPLLAPDPDAPLDLGAVMAVVYERGGYDVQIDYQQPPPPPALKEEESAWLQQLLHQT
ncbi:MAG: DUF4058 family protein [Caldilineaceae bacterium]